MPENKGTKLTNPAATGYSAVPPFHYNDFGWDLLAVPSRYIQPKGKLFFFAGQEWKKLRGLIPGGPAALGSRDVSHARKRQATSTDIYNAGAATGLTLKTPAVIPASSQWGCSLYSAECHQPHVYQPATAPAIAALYNFGGANCLCRQHCHSTNSNNMTFNSRLRLTSARTLIRVDEHPNEKNRA